MWKAPGPHSEIISSDSLFEKRRGDRPTSASRVESRSYIAPKSRPRTALKKSKHTSGLLRNRSKLFVQEQNYTLLTKLKPRGVATDKERLYEDNLALKHQNNQLRDENTRLKTKLSTLDRELSRREDTIYELKGIRSPVVKKTQALVSLKQGVRELKLCIEEKDREIADLKKNIKGTKLGEMQIEIQAYVDECTRLRRHYDDLVKQQEQQHLNRAHRVELTEQIEQARRDNRELVKELEALKTDRDNWERVARSLDKKKSGRKKSPSVKKLRKTIEDITEAHKKQIGAHEAEISSLKAECSRLREMLKGKEAGKASEPIKIEENYVSTAERPKTSPRTDLVTSPLRDGRLQIPSVPQQVMVFSNASSPHTDKQLTAIAEEDHTVDHSPELVKGDSLQISEAEIQHLLTHIRFRVQLHRVAKSDLNIHLRESIPDNQSSKTVLELLKAEPFSIEDYDTRIKVVAFLCPKSVKKEFRSLKKQDVEKAKISIDEFASNLLKRLGDWAVLSQDDEARFDQKISDIMLHNQFTLLESCKLYDEDLTGVISFKHFEEVMDNLDIEFSNDELKYLQLLFYSHDSQLDKVPYQQFIKAFSLGPKQEDSLDEEARTELVKTILQTLANELKARKIRVKELFKDVKGLLDANAVVQGFKKLGIPELDHNELFTFIEALAAENAEELCISIDYLEEILSHYGVPIVTDDIVESQQQLSSRNSLPQFSTKTYESSILKSERSEFDPPKFDSESEHSEHQERISLLESPSLSADAGSNYEYSEDSPDKMRMSQNLTDQSPFFSPGYKLWAERSGPTSSNTSNKRIIRVEGITSTENVSSASYSEDFEGTGF
mmetsp:Transcript_5825/g.10390  ORF Transcript_5825/g.10390 Transcript_5825/m.10390 type:complete len:838 (+) Transcript_5825:2555-5068(+)|eukprot:CAMPEP_0204911310 /NCGR_PEP_ID=MMETSP1397-20131031/9684_1 /ASSEMBLY_ACC=CAM_ASM_000891 /TAXON_ID=49980 /ORGANISM="Climacostomum Climacostomum virens, Strain Stock W-24" /LENGTH=837 /DNA_ID=CAMNT_0052081825 /DNA_START=94 /DNA_END=2607 /DNA_ORIENTATION=-